MMRSVGLSAWLSLALVLLAWGFGTGFSQAQASASRIGTVELLTIEHDWDKDAKEDAKRFELLRRGEQPVSEDSKSLLDDGAKWFAYRLTLPQYQEPVGTGNKTMHDMVKQALAQIVDPRKPANPNQIAFMEEFGKRFVIRLDEVMRNRKEIARVNAALILAQLAATGVEEAADPLIEAILDPKENDAVRYHAFRGLKDLFVLGRGDNPSPFKKKEREARAAAALLTYVQSKSALRPSAGHREVAAIGFVRSEAMVALGETRFPAVSTTVNKKTTIERPTALALLRVMRRVGQPEQLTLREQIAATIGLCQLKSALCEEYQPDYVAYHLGQFVLDFASHYNKESPAPQTGKDAAAAPKRFPWKTQAAHLIQALEEFKADTSRLEAAPYIGKLVAQAEGVLQAAVNGERLLETRTLAGWLAVNPPPHKTVYKDLDSSKIVEPERTDE
jgi:hypothetical protein